MQGSGTEADPYLPTTISEFITACSSSSSYVKLTQDIDAYDDSSYVGELTTAVNINSDRLYADTPVVVKNVTVRASHMIYFGRNIQAKQYVENIHFLNWVHKKIDNGSTIYWTGYHSSSSSHNNYVNNCKFSVKIDNGPYYPLIFDKYSECVQALNCKFCSFYFEYPENMTSITTGDSSAALTLLGYLSLTYCNMIIKNLNVRSCASSYYSNALLHVWKLVKTSVIFDTIKIYTSGSGTNCMPVEYINSLDNANVSYSYIAFVNPALSWPSGPSAYYPTIYMQGSNITSYPFQNCLFATSDTRIKKDGIVSGVTCLTLEQLKDKEYLEGIGWLP